ncbi:MAG TPA: hypothetical protein VEO95_08710 [Chthoniobacteraceae bacterium]|nr:hypothetical protein [Chthoniobacteraceae bacterium]
MQDPDRPAECCPDLKAKFEDWKACAERSVREDPFKVAGAAFVTGIFLTVLPIGAILGGLVRLALALLRPALLVLGIVKVVEEFSKQTKS